MLIARLSASPPFSARPAAPRQSAREVPRATLYRRLQMPAKPGPSCPLPPSRIPTFDIHRLSVSWYKRRTSDGIDWGDLRCVEQGLHGLGRVDIACRATCMNDLDRDGLTWLMRAACAGNLYMVQHLIRNDADPRFGDAAGLNAADWALLHRHAHIVEALQAYGVRPRYAHLTPAGFAYLAVHFAHPALLALWVGRKLGRPLKHRIHPELGPAPVCTHVLTDGEGRFTPLTAVAHVHPNERAIEVVLRYQDATASTLEGDAAIVLAAYSAADTSEALHQMLHKGASVHAQSREGWSLAHLIAAYCHTPLPGLQVLLDHDGDLHAVTRDGWTALHFLLTQGDCPQAVAYLLQQGANPHQRTRPTQEGNPGVTALDLARRYNRLQSLVCMQG